jgi:hypothetical protein
MNRRRPGHHRSATGVRLAIYAGLAIYVLSRAEGAA